MFCQDHHEKMWVAPWEAVDELELPTRYHRETMVAAFVTSTGEYVLNILLRRQSMDTSYFTGEIIGALEDLCHLEGRNPHEGKWLFILTLRPYTTAEPSCDNWSNQRSREWSIV
jgi:hypothetical protein